MKIFRKVPGPGAVYQVIGHAGPQPVTSPGTAGHTFPADVPVQPGDLLGLWSPGNGSSCFFSASGEQVLIPSSFENLSDGEAANFDQPLNNVALNISAVLSPTNTFTLGGVTRNKEKGTATVALDVPNPGQLTASGKGVRDQAATINAPGSAVLAIKAQGKQKRKLNSTGKVTLNVAVTYTPNGGTANTQSLVVKLKKKT